MKKLIGNGCGPGACAHAIEEQSSNGSAQGASIHGVRVMGIS
jgi:hypothetical protein